MSGFVAGWIEVAGGDGSVYDENYRWSSNFILWFFAGVFIIWGFLRIAWGLFFELNSRMLKRKGLEYARQTASLQTGADSPEALPPRQSIPVEEYATRRFDSAVPANAPSVVEDTTKPLKN
jgi:hypothetical protein